MNPRMWANPATRRNMATLIADGIATVGPNAGEMAERGELGLGAWPSRWRSSPRPKTCLRDAGAGKPLIGKRVIVNVRPDP